MLRKEKNNWKNNRKKKKVCVVSEKNKKWKMENEKKKQLIVWLTGSHPEHMICLASFPDGQAKQAVWWPINGLYKPAIQSVL